MIPVKLSLKGLTAHYWYIYLVYQNTEVEKRDSS